MRNDHRYRMRYGDMHGTGTRYCVIDMANPELMMVDGPILLGGHEISRAKVVFTAESKSACISEAQRLNGFEPVDGSEETYGEQTR